MARMTKTELSKRYGICTKTLRKYELAGVDIHDHDAVRAHQAIQRSNPIPTTSELQELKAEGLRLANERSRKLLAVVEGEYLLEAEIEFREARIAHVVNALTRAIATDLPSLLAGMDEQGIEARIKEWRVKWIDDLQDAQSALWKEARKATLAGLKGDMKRVAEAAFERADNPS